MPRPNISRAIPALVFVATAVLYIRTAAPTLGGAFDSEEFQHVAYTLGIAHATGYPLYLLLGKLFVTLVPIGNVAYRMNLLSAIIGAGVATLVYAITFHLTRRQIASVATATIFATNAAVWRQSGVASVGPLTLFFMAAVTFAALLWEEHRISVALIAFVFGLALTHHHTILFFLPWLAAFILIEDFKILTRPRNLVSTVIWFLIPLLIYLYVPIRGSVSEWYNNSLESFYTQVLGTDAGDFLRSSPTELLQAAVTLFHYYYSSFTLIGAPIIVVGAISVIPRIGRWQTPIGDRKATLLFGFGTCVFVGIGLLYGGEPDRYLSLSFFFIVFWFGIGAAFLQNLIAARFKSHVQSIAQIAVAILVAFPIVFTFRANFKYADWGSFDRVYKQWNEIFTLPIPQNATIIGNWGQLNAMRYMQYVENRRRDLRAIGTLYDPKPQTDAAREAFDQQRAIFLAPGIAQPSGEYRYALLGPLLEVRDQPQTRAPDSIPIQKSIAINPALTLVGYGVSTALEPYAQTQTITPTRTARVSLFWRAEGTPRSFLVRLRLYDPEGRFVSQLDEPPVRGLYPVPQWTHGEFVNDVHNFLIPGGAPPGKYSLTLAMLDESKSQTNTEIDLATFNIEHITNLSREQVFIAHSLDLVLNDRIGIVGYGGFEGTHQAGESIVLNLLWAAREDVGDDATAFFALEDPSGKRVLEWQRAPIAYYLPQEWKKGEFLKAYYDVKLPNDLQAGEVSLKIGLSSNTMTTIGFIQITQ